MQSSVWASCDFMASASGVQLLILLVGLYFAWTRLRDQRGGGGGVGDDAEIYVVKRVIDGDTILVVDGAGVESRVRVAMIDTPGAHACSFCRLKLKYTLPRDGSSLDLTNPRSTSVLGCILSAQRRKSRAHTSSVLVARRRRARTNCSPDARFVSRWTRLPLVLVPAAAVTVAIATAACYAASSFSPPTRISDSPWCATALRGSIRRATMPAATSTRISIRTCINISGDGGATACRLRPCLRRGCRVRTPRPKPRLRRTDADCGTRATGSAGRCDCKSAQRQGVSLILERVHASRAAEFGVCFL